MLRSGAASSEVLKREVLALSRDLLAERTKVRALSEELENPLNVHRCIFSLPQHANPAEELGVLLHAAASTHTLGGAQASCAPQSLWNAACLVGLNPEKCHCDDPATGLYRSRPDWGSYESDV